MQKHSVKLLLKTNKKNELGQTPIYLRIIKDRKVVFISTGYAIPERLWDAKNELVKEGYAFYKQINEDIVNKKQEVLQELVNASVKGRQLSASGVKDLQKGKLNDIFSFAETFSRQAKGKKSDSTIINYEKHLRKLEEFQGSRSLAFEQIDPDYLYSFEEYLRSGKGVSRREGSEGSNYIDAIMRTIRTLFNAARKKGIVDHYPFTQYEMPKVTGGNKAYLSMKELDLWHKFTFETEHKILKEVALYFLFGCYTGLRLSDWKEFSEAKIRERNISLKATKNKAWVNVPLHDRLLQVLQEMKKVPLTLREPTINRDLKKIASYLKINKSLSTHCGRKTFAVTLCLEKGISSETAAKLMGITLAVFEKNYSYVTAEKIQLETEKAWKGL